MLVRCVVCGEVGVGSITDGVGVVCGEVGVGPITDGVGAVCGVW